MSEACGFLNAMEHANKLSLQGWSQHGRFQNASCDYCNSCLSDSLKKIFNFVWFGLIVCIYKKIVKNT
jgi:hypothetical protein